MKYKATLLRARDLTESHVCAWRRLRDANNQLTSPFFCPEFTQVMGSVNENVCVAVISKSDGVPCAFLPLELLKSGCAKGLDMCDYQGVISGHSFLLNAKSLLRSCGLKSLRFDHLLASQQEFMAFQEKVADSPLMDLTEGYAGYRDSLAREGRDVLRKANTSTRRIEREIGRLRYVDEDDSRGVLRALFEWRTAKYGPAPVVADRVLDKLLGMKRNGFRGVLSSLHAGDNLIAAHFGIRSDGVLHYWFPAYNPKFSPYSPGILLLLLIAEQGSKSGLKMIDLGKGYQSYKLRLQNRMNQVADATVELWSFASTGRTLRRKSYLWVRRRPFLFRLAKRAREILGAI